MIFNPNNLASDFYSVILAVPAGGTITDSKKSPTIYIGVRVAGAANGVGIELNGYDQVSMAASFSWGVRNNETQILPGSFGDIIFSNAGGSNVNVQLIRAYMV